MPQVAIFLIILLVSPTFSAHGFLGGDLPLSNNINDKNSLITIGAHTHNHPNLKILNKDEAIDDICKCTKILENLLKHKIKHFAYPYGGMDQADTREYDIIKNLNFNSAVTDRVYPIKDDNLFSLPRIGIGKNANEKEIYNHLTGFYNLAFKFCFTNTWAL